MSSYVFLGAKRECVFLPPSPQPPSARARYDAIYQCFLGAELMLYTPCTDASRLTRQGVLSPAFARGGS